MEKTILVTGGAGFIGAQTCLELLKKGFEVVVVDNLCNASKESLHRVEKLSGRSLKFYDIDIRDREGRDKIFTENKIDSIIHFAALKAVGESCHRPIEYYDNNLVGTLVLLEVRRAHNVKSIIFSSSATVYGLPKKLPLDETCAGTTSPSPYGETKVIIERRLRDIEKADPSWNIVLLRYFNPIGADPSGEIGENPHGIPNNLRPYIGDVAIGKLDHLNVFGDDYPTKDGTCIRDYIHVVDLALGHIAAIEHCTKPGVHIYNLGTGVGYSVLDIVHTFEKATGVKVPYVIAPRRDGDVPVCYASAEKAKKELGWVAKYNLTDRCKDEWNWMQKNPNGYEEK